MVYKRNFLRKALSTLQSHVDIFIYYKEQDVMIWRFCCCSTVITICMSKPSLFFSQLSHRSLGPFSFLAMLPRLPYSFLRQNISWSCLKFALVKFERCQTHACSCMRAYSRWKQVLQRCKDVLMRVCYVVVSRPQ